jgi:hypothetical protein
MLAIALAEKNFDELLRFAEGQMARQLDELARIDLVKLVGEKLEDGRQPDAAMDEVLRSIRQSIESSARRTFDVASPASSDFAHLSLQEPGYVDETLFQEIAERLEQGPAVEKDEYVSEDEFWMLVKEAALTELKADKIDSPEVHAAYVRERINSVFDDVQP